MNTSIYNISLLNLLWVMIPVAVVIVMVPVAIVIVIYIRWTQDKVTLFYALFRMLIQLILIGYVLTYIFDANSPYLVILILCVMLIAASIIAMRPLRKQLNSLYLHAFLECTWRASLLECWYHLLQWCERR